MAKKSKTAKLVIPRKSPEEIRQDLERRRSSAACRHTLKGRKGSRTDRKLKAIREGGW